MSKNIDEVFSNLNGSGSHACYCQRSTDGGCACALKDEYLIEAKQAILTDLMSLMPEKFREEPQMLPNGKDITNYQYCAGRNDAIDAMTAAIKNYIEGA